MQICHSLRSKQINMSTADRLISALRNNARIIYGLSEVIFDLAGADTGGVVGWISTPLFE